MRGKIRPFRIAESPTNALAPVPLTIQCRVRELSAHKARNLMDPACGAGPQYVTLSSPLDRRRPGRPVAIHAQFTPSRIDRGSDATPYPGLISNLGI